MSSERSKAILQGQRINRFYSGLSREKLIDELTETESIISSKKISGELKFLYTRRYMKILEILKEKLEKFQPGDFNEKVS